MYLIRVYCEECILWALEGGGGLVAFRKAGYTGK